MVSTTGWLFVDSNSATFVSDDPNFVSRAYPWQMLADGTVLESFLLFFPPLKQSLNSSYASYYLEIDSDVLDDWFKCLERESESASTIPDS